MNGDGRATLPFGTLFAAETGLLDRAAFASQPIYERETHSIFARCWLFVAPASRLIAPGAVVATSAGEAPIIAWRGADGRLRLFANRCPHGDLPFCHDGGQASVLHCRCHGFAFASDGTAIGGAERALIPVARVDSWRGLVFANRDPLAPPLKTSLRGSGIPLARLLDRLGGAADSCAEAPLRWELHANWKLPADTFAGGALGGEPSAESGTVFPNLSFDAAAGCLLVWHPRGPNRTEVHLHCLIGTVADAACRRERQREGQFRFAPNNARMRRLADAWQTITAEAGKPHACPIPAAFPLDGETGERAFYAWWQERLRRLPNAQPRGERLYLHALGAA